jgi:diadenosine tetraphosphate (Ap4A) HIT family hydrolase
MNNAHFPWLILVPHSPHTEFFELDASEQLALMTSINSLSVFIKQQFSSDRLNIATIGNIVSQLHIHIIGRSSEDICWPGVVWGTAHRKAYASADVEWISAALAAHLGSDFIASSALL